MIMLVLIIMIDIDDDDDNVGHLPVPEVDEEVRNAGDAQ